MCRSGAPATEIAGFVLVGGRSSRMGRDKALLPWLENTLAGHMARIVQRVTSSVALVGPAERYSQLGFSVIPDLYPGFGPVGAIATALTASNREWNLVVACDMPALDETLLKRLCYTAVTHEAACTLPVTGDGRCHPLCAVYRKTALPVLNEAISRGEHKLMQAVAHLHARELHLGSDETLWNVNTPQDWEAFQASQVPKIVS